jgi:hypothetical protein
MSEIAAEILIVILVIVMAMAVYAVFSGFLNPLFFQKSVYIAGNAAVASLPSSSSVPDQVLAFTAQAGDPFFLTGQSNGISGTQVTLRAISPDGATVIPDASSLSGSLYGKPLYIYPNGSTSATQCNYVISSTVPTGNLRAMAVGCWTVQLTDENVHVLVGSYSTSINQGTTSLPVAGGFVGGSTSQFYDVNCDPIPQTITGNLVTSSTGPGNMTATYFNGASSITIPDSTELNFTGAMSISMWFNPSEAVPYSGPNGVGWQQLIGKGVTNSAGSGSSNENDNYQLFQLGNELLFEWNDATTGQHYQAITTTTPVQANQWNYVTVTVSGTGGQVAIYYNGVSQPLTYDNSNVPGQNPLGTAPPVNLESNNNNINIGEQNYATDSSDAFYFSGSMGSTALYNRPLTPQEIAANYAGNTA